MEKGSRSVLCWEVVPFSEGPLSEGPEASFVKRLSSLRRGSYIVLCDLCWLQGIDRGVSWVSNKIVQGTEAAGNLIIKVRTSIKI